MRRNFTVKSTMDLHSAPRLIKPFAKGLIGVSLIGLCLSGSAMAQGAQDSVYVDVSDPNITIDLSVLDDGGQGARSALPNVAPNNTPTPIRSTNATARTSMQQPSKNNVPVSTLYIQPSRSLNLPPQTKPLLVLRAPGQKIVKAEAMVPVVQPTLKKVDVVASTPTPPPAAVVKAPIVKAKPVTKVEAPVKVEAAPAPKAPVAAPVVKVVEAKPVPAPAPTPARVAKAVTPPPPPAPAPMPLTQSSTPKAEKTMAPPPQAIAKAPETTSTTTVVDLPPKNTAAQPGVASLSSPSGPLTDGDNMRIVFDTESSKLPQDARDALKALSEQLKSQDGLRLQLLAYAGTADTSASAARRLSLSRALAVRSHLIESGVRSTRIDVRALGNKSSDEITERVDITVVER